MVRYLVSMITCVVGDSGAATEVKLRGEAIMANAQALKEQLVAAIVPGRDLIVDLDGLERLDGAVIQLLIALKAHVESGGRALSVVALADIPRLALEVAGAAAVLGTQ